MSQPRMSPTAVEPMLVQMILMRVPTHAGGNIHVLRRMAPSFRKEAVMAFMLASVLQTYLSSREAASEIVRAVR